MTESRRKKVLLLTPLPPPVGGIATWSNAFLKSDISKQYDVEVINTAIRGKRAKRFDEMNIFEEIQRNIIILSFCIKKRLLGNYDIVHLNSCCSKRGIIRDYLLANILKMKKAKIIVHYHCDVSEFCNTRISKKYLSKIINISDKTLVLNSSSREFIYNEFGEESVLVPNFVSDNKIKNISRMNVKKNVESILYVGRIEKAKGCEKLFRVAERNKNIQFKLIGSLSNDIDISSLPENINLIGGISNQEVFEVMQESDVFILLSYHEGFPLVILEAMACGLPIISTNVGAISDILEHEGGIIVNASNIEAVQAAINKISDFTIRKNMSDWNVNKFTLNYRENEVIKIFQDIYQEVIG